MKGIKRKHNFLNLKGRINRLSFCTYQLIIMIVVLIDESIINYNNGQNVFVSFLALAIAIVCLVASINFIVQRFHDLNYSGFRFFLLLIPIYNIYLSLILFFKKGTDN